MDFAQEEWPPVLCGFGNDMVLVIWTAGLVSVSRDQQLPTFILEDLHPVGNPRVFNWGS